MTITMKAPALPTRSRDADHTRDCGASAGLPKRETDKTLLPFTRRPKARLWTGARAARRRPAAARRCPVCVSKHARDRVETKQRSGARGSGRFGLLRRIGVAQRRPARPVSGPVFSPVMEHRPGHPHLQGPPRPIPSKAHATSHSDHKV
jgi:hypothetical protein